MTESIFDFSQWLTEARVATRSVDVFQRPDLIGNLQDWQRRMDAAKKAAEGKPVETALGERSPIQVLEEEGDYLLEQVQAARTVWYLAALTDRTEESIEKAFPLPAPPVVFDLAVPRMPDSPTEKQAEAFLAAWEAWKVEETRFLDEHADVFTAYQDAWNEVVRNRQAERIAQSVVSIVQGGVRHKVELTSDQVKTLETVLGKPQIDKILQALEQAKNEDPEKAVPAAFLSRS